MRGQPRHNTRPHARSPPLEMDAWVSLQLNVAFDLKAACVIDVLGIGFDMSSMGVRTTRHWQTSGRLVQELHVCTVCTHILTPVIA